MRYCGCFYRSALSTFLARINSYLVRWIRKKYRRLRARRKARVVWERLIAATSTLLRALGLGP